MYCFKFLISKIGKCRHLTETGKTAAKIGIVYPDSELSVKYIQLGHFYGF